MRATRQPLTAQIGEHHQLEEIDRRVAPLGEAAGGRAASDANRRLEQAAVVPPLQLARREAGERRDLAELSC